MRTAVLPRRTPSSGWAVSTRSPSPASTTGRTRRTCSSNRSASGRTSLEYLDTGSEPRSSGTPCRCSAAWESIALLLSSHHNKNNLFLSPSLLVGIVRPCGCVTAQPPAVVPDAPLGHVEDNGGEEEEEEDNLSPTGARHSHVATLNRLNNT